MIQPLNIDTDQGLCKGDRGGHGAGGALHGRGDHGHHFGRKRRAPHADFAAQPGTVVLAALHARRRHTQQLRHTLLSTVIENTFRK